MASTVRASHILVKTEEEANQIIKKISQGDAHFDDLARRFSHCPSKRSGGDLGWFRKGQMVPEFEKAAFDAEVGKTVGPVKTQFGFHIIKVTEKR